MPPFVPRSGCGKHRRTRRCISPLPLDDIGHLALMSELREKVTAVFEKHRAAPGTPYDES